VFPAEKDVDKITETIAKDAIKEAKEILEKSLKKFK
jgi:hypothetical protein